MRDCFDRLVKSSHMKWTGINNSEPLAYMTETRRADVTLRMRALYPL
jgi:hypothetical protein